MSAKPQLNKITQLFNDEENAIANLNNNIDILNEVLQDYLSRSGKVPTQMTSELDMGTKRIINVGEPSGDLDVVRYKDIKDALEDLRSVQQYLQDAINAALRAAESANNAAASANAAALSETNSQAIYDALLGSPVVMGVYNDLATITAVYNDLSSIDAVYADLTAIETVYNHMTAVDGVYNDLTNIDAVYADLANIDYLAANSGKILLNNSTGSFSALSILGDATTTSGSVSVGSLSSAGNYGVAVGPHATGSSYYAVSVGSDASATGRSSIAIGGEGGGNKGARASGDYAIAIGAANTSNKGPYASAKNAIQIGPGTNSTANTFNVGLSDNDNYNLLKSNGNVPEERLKEVMIKGASNPTTSTAGTVGLLYKNTTTGGIFKCTNVSGGTYTWRELGTATIAIADAVDVDLNNLANNDLLVYNSTSQKWENGAITIPTVDQTYDSTSANAQSGIAVASAVSGKQDTLVSGTNIKTINNTSLLGSGDITISGGAGSLSDIAVAGDNVTFTPPPFGELNATVVGSPTISSSFVASGFSDSNYLTTTDILNNATTSFEVVVPFSTTQSTSTNCSLIDKSQTGNRTSFRLEQNSLKIQCRLSNDPSNYTYFATLTGTTTLTVNTKYWAKVTYDNVDGYKLFLSTDGENWNLEASTALTTMINQDLNTPLMIGDNATSGSSFPGSIYLDGTYINVNNGEYEWHAVNMTTDKTKIDVNVPADVLKNSATGANSLSILGTATGTYSLSMLGNAMSYNSAVALGSGARCQDNYAIAVGASARAAGAHSTYIGNQNNVNDYAGGDYSICIGYNSSTNPGHYGIAIGASSYAGGYGVSLGSNAKTGANAIAIGNNANTGANQYAIQLGPGTNSTANTFSVGLSSNNNYRLLDSDGIVPIMRLISYGSGAPTGTGVTGADLGRIYMDITNEQAYICVKAELVPGLNTYVYTWEQIQTGSGGGSGVAKETYTNPALTSSSDYCTWTITHGLNTKDVVVSVYRTDDDVEPMVNIIHSSTSTVTVVFNSSADIAAGAYKAVIIG